MQNFFAANLSKISFVVLLLIIFIAIFIIYNGTGHIEGVDTGAGDYYYTDIPGWEKMFLGESNIKMGTNQIILFFILFFGWGLLCYKFLKWVDKK